MPSAAAQPNILIFMTDQQRGDIVLDGALNRAKTPRLDAFRRQGLTFTELHGPSPHCCPARATFFTGLYPSRHGVWNNVNVGNALSREPYPDAPFWSRTLKEAGYRLAFSGKWHVSDHDGPARFGWEERHVTASPQRERSSGPVTYEWESFYRPDRLSSRDPAARQPGEIQRPGYPAYQHYGVSENPFGDNDVVEAALASMEDLASGSQPWCQFVGTLGPHDPYFPPQEFLDLYDIADIQLPPSFDDSLQDKPALYRKTRRPFDQLDLGEQREAIRHYLAFCTYEDHLFGRILDALEATGQADNTLVIFTSDHGDYMADHGLWCKGLPAFRSAYHVPFVARWPQGIAQPGRSCDALVSLADFAPTFLEIAGTERPEEPRPAGASLCPFFRNESPNNWRDAHFTQSNGNELYGIQRTITTADWKFVWNGFDEDELYDLKDDPQEMRNLASDPSHRDTIERLMTRIWRFARKQQDTCINPYIMVAHAPLGPGILLRE